MNAQRIPLAERLLAKTSPEPNSGCWLWTGGVFNSGYGAIALPYDPKNGTEMVAAHRVAYELLRGPIPVGLNVLHKCDVRSCVNPDHLFVGKRHRVRAPAQVAGEA